MKSLRVYVAGPYSKGDVAVNVRNALLAAEELVKIGHVPYVPHLTHFWHCVFPHVYEFWLEFDKEWLRRCEVLLRLPGDSSGADKEVALAHELGIPVYFSLDEIRTLKLPPLDVYDGRTCRERRKDGECPLRAQEVSA